jgi:hypothetical protein
MEFDPVFRQYCEKRTSMYERLDAIHVQISEWIDRHAGVWPELTDLALLEALHLEREKIFTEFQTTENAFIEYVLKRRRE